MNNIYKVQLPGIGKKYQFETINGDTVILVQFLDGKCELFLNSLNQEVVSISLSKKETRMLSFLLNPNAMNMLSIED